MRPNASPTERSIRYVNGLLTVIAFLVVISLGLTLYLTVQEAGRATTQSERNETILRTVRDNQQVMECLLLIVPADRTPANIAACRAAVDK